MYLLIRSETFHTQFTYDKHLSNKWCLRRKEFIMNIAFLISWDERVSFLENCFEVILKLIICYVLRTSCWGTKYTKSIFNRTLLMVIMVLHYIVCTLMYRSFTIEYIVVKNANLALAFFRNGWMCFDRFLRNVTKEHTRRIEIWLHVALLVHISLIHKILCATKMYDKKKKNYLGLCPDEIWWNWACV